ncbi:MAG: HEAT repeat domain-containing protein [Planctomycetota bacterium]
MDIHFCDICSESIPVGDVESGRAVRFGDRFVCRRCDEAMTRHVAPAAAQSAEFEAVQAGQRGHAVHSPGGTVWLAASCVGVMALLGYLSVERVKETEHRVEVDAAIRMEALDARIARMERRFEELLAGDPFRTPEDPRIGRLLDEVRALGERGTDTTDIEALLSEFGTSLDEIRENSEGPRADPQRTAQLDRIEADLGALREDLGVLARSMLEVLDRAPVVDAPPADVRREAAEAQPGWLAFVGGLSSRDESERWNSIEELGASGDPAAAVHVVPMLRDDELFVRMAAARVLGDLGNHVAVPALIDALEDVEPSVREAAVISLRTLTGRSFGFDPNADPKDRTKRVQSWRDWWSGENAKGAGD